MKNPSIILSNRLRDVSDAVSSLDTGGFVDGNKSPTVKDYLYDANGNMIQDLNKGITEITYNHLNLPAKVTFESGDYILYNYTAAGEKVRKLVKAGDTVKEVDYLDGFQYAGGILQFFPHAEGYVKATVMTLGSNPGYMFDYVYNYTDHLGNIRISYTKDPKTGQLRILEENHYYPFGLKHEVYTQPIPRGLIKDDDNPGNTQVSIIRETEYMYKYNGKEFQDELDLNWYDFHARNYDPAIGRWMNPDPLAEKFTSVSPYNYALNNPVVFVDPDGMEVKRIARAERSTNDWKDNGDGTYTAEAGDSAGTLAKDANIDFERANELVQDQLGDNIMIDGKIQSNIEVGDIVTVPENIPIVLEELTIEGLSKETVVELGIEIQKVDNKIDSVQKIIDFNTMANEISEEAGLNQPVLGDPGGGIYFGEELNKWRRRREIRKNENKKENMTKKRDSIQNILNNSPQIKKNDNF